MSTPEGYHKAGPYRSRQGMIFGVCRGLAEYFQLSAAVLRVLVVIGFFCTGLWPVGAGYVIAAFLMKPEPVLPLSNDADAEFYNSYTTSRGMAIARLKRTYDRLDRRIQQMESIVTAKDFDWERRLDDDAAN